MGERVRVIRGVAVAALVAAGALAIPATASAAGVTVTSVAPSLLADGSTHTVTIHGSGFDQGGIVITVAGGGVTATKVAVQSATALTASVTVSPTAATGARSLTVTVGATYSGSLASALTVDPAPSLTTTAPADVVRGVLQRLLLKGANFEPGMLVTIAGSNLRGAAAALSSSTTASVEVTFGSHAALGPHTTTLANPDGGTVVDTAAPVVARVPTATSLSITTLNQDETTVATVAGANFLPGATVTAGPGVLANVVSVTPSAIGVSLHASAKTTVGPRVVRVVDGGVVVLRARYHVAYQPIFVKWAVGDGATDWTTTLSRPTTFATLPTLSFSGTGVTVATAKLSKSGHLVVSFTVAGGAAATWRTMTLTSGTSTWLVPRALKVRLPPVITSFPSLAEGTAFRTVQVKGRHFEVCAEKDPTVTISGTGATVNKASTAFGFLMYVNVSVAANAPTGPRNVTMTNCDSGGTAMSVGVFTVTS